MTPLEANILRPAPLDNNFEPKSETLLDTPHLRLVHMLLAQGEKRPPHLVRCDVVFQCLQGCVDVMAWGKPQRLHAGEMMHLGAEESHALHAVDDSSVLLTVIKPGADENLTQDVVDEASDESFPASDPPSYNVTRP